MRRIYAEAGRAFRELRDRLEMYSPPTESEMIALRFQTDARKAHYLDQVNRGMMTPIAAEAAFRADADALAAPYLERQERVNGVRRVTGTMFLGTGGENYMDLSPEIKDYIEQAARLFRRS